MGGFRCGVSPPVIENPGLYIEGGLNGRSLFLNRRSLSKFSRSFYFTQRSRKIIKLHSGRFQLLFRCELLLLLDRGLLLLQIH